MKENARNREALEYYYGSGFNRSYQSVASRFEVTERTVARWGIAFDWQQRVIDRDNKIADKVENKIDNKIATFKAKQLKIIDKLIVKFGEDGISAADVPDYEKLVKLSLLLRGEATDITQMPPVNIILKRPEK